MQPARKHTVGDLKRLQADLERKVSGRPGVCGVGIGLNNSGTDYAFKVMVEKKSAARDLPDRIDGVEVEFEVTGRVRAG